MQTIALGIEDLQATLCSGINFILGGVSGAASPRSSQTSQPAQPSFPPPAKLSTPSTRDAAAVSKASAGASLIASDVTISGGLSRGNLVSTSSDNDSGAGTGSSACSGLSSEQYFQPQAPQPVRPQFEALPAAAASSSSSTSRIQASTVVTSTTTQRHRPQLTRRLSSSGGSGGTGGSMPVWVPVHPPESRAGREGNDNEPGRAARAVDVSPPRADEVEDGGGDGDVGSTGSTGSLTPLPPSRALCAPSSLSSSPQLPSSQIQQSAGAASFGGGNRSIGMPAADDTITAAGVVSTGQTCPLCGGSGDVSRISGSGGGMLLTSDDRHHFCDTLNIITNATEAARHTIDSTLTLERIDAGEWIMR